MTHFIQYRSEWRVLLRHHPELREPDGAVEYKRQVIQKLTSPSSQQLVYARKVRLVGRGSNKTRFDFCLNSTRQNPENAG